MFSLLIYIIVFNSIYFYFNMYKIFIVFCVFIFIFTFLIFCIIIYFLVIVFTVKVYNKYINIMKPHKKSNMVRKIFKKETQNLQHILKI